MGTRLGWLMSLIRSRASNSLCPSRPRRSMIFSATFLLPGGGGQPHLAELPLPKELGKAVTRDGLISGAISVPSARHDSLPYRRRPETQSRLGQPSAEKRRDSIPVQDTPETCI